MPGTAEAPEPLVAVSPPWLVIGVQGLTAAEVVRAAEGSPGMINGLVSDWLVEAAEAETADAVENPPAPAPDPTPATDQPTIFRHSLRCYSLEQRPPVTVTREEDSILTAFQKRCMPMETAELENLSGVTNPSRVMKRLAHTFAAAAVRLPGKKGAGGYFVRVKPFPAV